MSGLIKGGENRAFRESLTHQQSEYIRTDRKPPDMVFDRVYFNTTEIDFANNRFCEDGRSHNLRMIEQGLTDDARYINWDMSAWYLSVYELPESVRNEFAVQEDLVYSAASVPLFQDVEINLLRKD